MPKAKNFNHLGSDLKLQYIEHTKLKPHKNNPRTHSKKQIEQIARSIQEFGFTNPILIDGNNNIIAGHGRVEASKKIGLDKVPIIQLSHLSDAQRHAYIIADNKLAENAGWDKDLLSAELEYIAGLDIEFDLTLTGFETTEIDLMLEYAPESTEDPPPPDINQEYTVTKPGDLWTLSPHRILCADATKPESYDLLLNKKKASMVFTDPPYNVPINGHVCGSGKVKHEEFGIASGEMSKEEFTKFLTTVFQNLKSYSINGSLHYICMDWRHMQEIITAGEIYDDFKNLCVWNKTNGGMGSLYRSKHELVFVYKNGKRPHINNIELGSNGRYRTNVWDYAGVNTFQNTDDLKMHPTVKPVAMVHDAILDCTKPKGIVLDAFGGSGSTLIAAENSRRAAYIMELDPKYVDVMIRRYQETTGKIAVDQNGKTFNERAEACHEQ